MEQQINAKDLMTVRTPDGTHEQSVPADRRNQAVLTPAQAVELAGLGGRIEELYGQPMDIEWALHDRRFFIGRRARSRRCPTTAQPPRNGTIA